jgi:hypothetical protein
MLMTILTDGLYQVTTHYFCAGFVIEGGKVTQCAPILRKNFEYWAKRAQKVKYEQHEN